MAHDIPPDNAAQYSVQFVEFPTTRLCLYSPRACRGCTGTGSRGLTPVAEITPKTTPSQAAQVILANSDGTYDDVERFIDWVFRGQRIILYEQNMEMTLDVRDIVADWALSSSSLSAEQLYR